MTIDPAVVIAAFGAVLTALGTAARLIYVDLKRERDYWREDSFYWREIAVTGTNIADKSTTIALRKRV